MEAQYQNLARNDPEWGQVAILPWDTEIFGFAVGSFAPGDICAIGDRWAELRKSLEAWAAENTVAVISCVVPSTEPRWLTVLPELGFSYVDSTFRYVIARLQRADFPRRHTSVRLATPADQEAVEQVCESAFQTGRYHADVRFPRALARRRYRAWVAREFVALNDNNRIYVIGAPGTAVAFTHARIDARAAYLSLGGAMPAVQRSVLPFAMFIGTVEALRDSGVRRVESKLSAANTPMMNLAAYAGAHFSEPEQVFHWHDPTAPQFTR